MDGGLNGQTTLPAQVHALAVLRLDLALTSAHVKSTESHPLAVQLELGENGATGPAVQVLVSVVPSPVVEDIIAPLKLMSTRELVVKLGTG